MNNKVILEGYQVEIISSENDGDNYRTAIMDGLSEKEAKLYVRFAEKFKSTNGCKSRGGAGFGNTNGGSDIETISKVFNDLCEDLGLAPDKYYGEDLEYELIGHWCDGQYRRVFEYAQVYYIPALITIKEVDISEW